jgi:anti-sigma factor RsiW
MNHDQQDRMKNLLRQALPPIGETDEPARGLWPAVLRRLDERSAPPWFDWALLAGVGVFAAVSPAWIPVLLYYL